MGHWFLPFIRTTHLLKALREARWLKHCCTSGLSGRHIRPATPGLYHSLLPAYEHWNYAQGSTNSVTFPWCDFCYDFPKQTMKNGYDMFKVSWCSFLLLTWHCSPEHLVLLVTAWLPLPEQDNVGLPHNRRCLVQKHHYSCCTGAILFSSKHLLWCHPSCTRRVLELRVLVTASSASYQRADSEQPNLHLSSSILHVLWAGTSAPWAFSRK